MLTYNREGTNAPPDRRIYGAVPSANDRYLNTKYSPDANLSDSFFVVALCTILSESTWGLFSPTLWLFVESLSGNLETAVTIYASGRVISCIILGWALDRYDYLYVLKLACICSIFGAVLYAMATSSSCLYLAQFALGIGGGKLAVCRAHIAESTNQDERTVRLANLTAVRYGSIIVLPFLGSLLAAYGTHQNQSMDFLKFVQLRVDEFNVPALALMLGSTLCLGLISMLSDGRNERNSENLVHVDEQERSSSFNDVSHIAVGKKSLEMTQINLEMSHLLTDSAYKLYLQTAPVFEADRQQRALGSVIVACALNALFYGTFVSDEAVIVSVAFMHLHWTFLRVCSMLAVCGLVGVACLLCMGYWRMERADDRIMLAGIGFMFISNLLLWNANSLTGNYLYVAVVSLFGLGYPLAQFAITAKVATACNQRMGLTMGLFSAFESAARVLFPLILSGSLLGNHTQGQDDAWIRIIPTLLALTLIAGIAEVVFMAKR